MRPLKFIDAAVALALGLALAACGNVAVKNQNQGQQQSSVGTPARTGTMKVALLAPLTGDVGPVGQQLVNAAAVALFERPDLNVELLPFDTRGTPEGAAQAASQARTANVELVLGPLFGSNVPMVRQGLAGSNITLLAFTNDATQAGGPNFVMGLSVGAQVEPLVSHLASGGKTRLIVIGPDNEYTQRAIDAARNATFATGGSVVRTAAYPEEADFNDISNQVQATTDYQARRGEWQSYSNNLKPKVRSAADPAATLRQEATRFPPDDMRGEMLRGMATVYNNWKSSGRNRALAEVMQRIDGVDAMPVSDYDAVLLPIGDDNLVAIGSMLDLFNAGRGFATLAGTNVWQNVNLSAEPSLLGGWFSQTSESAISPFVLSYQNSFQETPESIAALGYHGARIAMEAMTAGSRPVTGEFVRRPEGFTGSAGTVRFGSDNLMRHPISIYEVTPEGVKELRGPDQPGS